MDNRRIAGIILGSVLIAGSILLYKIGSIKKDIETLNSDGYPLRLDKSKIPQMIPYGTPTLVALTGKEYTYDGKYYITPLVSGYKLILIRDFGTSKNGYSYNSDGTINGKFPDTVAAPSNDATKYGLPYAIDLTKTTDIMQPVTGFDTPQKVGIKYKDISFFKEQDGGYSTSVNDGKSIMLEFYYDKDGKFVKMAEISTQYPITDATKAGLPYSLDLHKLVMNPDTHVGVYSGEKLSMGSEGEMMSLGDVYNLPVTVNEVGNLIIKKDIYQYVYSQDDGTFIKKV